MAEKASEREEGGAREKVSRVESRRGGVACTVIAY